MLHKQMSWLRRSMQDTFDEGNRNWCLPLNHFIGLGKSADSIQFANVARACHKLGGPFNPANLNHLIGGNIRLYNSQMRLYQFTRQLKDAQSIRREAILPTENGGYQLQLAINEVIRLPSIINDNQLAGGAITPTGNNDERNSLMPNARRFSTIRFDQFGGTGSGGGSSSLFNDFGEKRYLLEQALDHELQALLATLQYNLKTIGYPIETGSYDEDEWLTQENLFKSPLHSDQEL